MSASTPKRSVSSPSAQNPYWFYVNKKGVQEGPASLQDMRRLWGTEIDDTTPVWAKGLSDWKQIADVPPLKAVLEGSTPKKLSSSSENIPPPTKKHFQAITPTPSNSLSLLYNDWLQLRSKKGEYWYNIKTRETSWDMPEELTTIDPLVKSESTSLFSPSTSKNNGSGGVVRSPSEDGGMFSPEPIIDDEKKSNLLGAAKNPNFKSDSAALLLRHARHMLEYHSRKSRFHEQEAAYWKALVNTMNQSHEPMLIDTDLVSRDLSKQNNDNNNHKDLASGMTIDTNNDEDNNNADGHNNHSELPTPLAEVLLSPSQSVSPDEILRPITPTSGEAPEREWREIRKSRNLLNIWEDDGDTCLMFDAANKLKCATLNKLTEYVCSGNQDMELVETTIMTCRLYSTPLCFASKMVNYASFRDDPQALEIVAAVFDRWLSSFTHDFNNPEFLYCITEFANSMKKTGKTEKLSLSIKKKVHDYTLELSKDMQHDEELRRFVEPSTAKTSLRDRRRAISTDPGSLENSPVMSPSLSSRRASVSSFHLPEATLTPALQDFNELEVAQQLALIEMDLFKNIKFTEFLGQSWSKKDKATRAPGIVTCVKWFNKVSGWVASEIVNETTAKDRAAVLRKFIWIAAHCHNMKNFNGVMQIMSGLHNSAIYRLKQTWALVPARDMEKYEELEQLTSPGGNHKNLRSKIEDGRLPCIPYMGVYLTQLTFIDDGNPDYVDGCMINLAKHRMTRKTVAMLRRLQESIFVFRPNQAIYNYLSALSPLSEDECHRRSLQYEQRNAS